MDEKDYSHPVAEGRENGLYYSVFDLGGVEQPGLKAMLSFDYSRSDGSDIFSKPGMKDTLNELDNPDLVQIKEENGRIYALSDLSNAAPGAIAEEFVEIYETVTESDIFGH